MHARTVSYEGCGASVWKLVCAVVCEDLCQPDDSPLILQEQKALLAPALALLSALYSNLQPDISEDTHVFTLPTIISHSWPVFNIISLHFAVLNTGSALVASLLRILYFNHENQQGVHQKSEDRLTDGKTEKERDVQLQVLAEIAAELLSTLLTDLPMVRFTECVVRLQTVKSPASCLLGYQQIIIERCIRIRILY